MDRTAKVEMMEADMMVVLFVGRGWFVWVPWKVGCLVGIWGNKKMYEEISGFMLIAGKGCGIPFVLCALEDRLSSIFVFFLSCSLAKEIGGSP